MSNLNNIDTMGASNFSFDNRCIVVTNDDFEMGNVPSLTDKSDRDRCYPSTILTISDDFRFWDIVLTYGYYEHACIDYRDNEVTCEDWLGAWHYYSSQQELFEFILNEFKTDYKLTPYRLRKVCGNKRRLSMEEYYNVAIERLTEYLRGIEEEQVNKVLDTIKKEYGYDEVAVSCRFSNGETWYSKIG